MSSISPPPNSGDDQEDRLAAFFTRTLVAAWETLALPFRVLAGPGPGIVPRVVGVQVKWLHLDDQDEKQVYAAIEKVSGWRRYKLRRLQPGSGSAYKGDGLRLIELQCRRGTEHQVIASIRRLLPPAARDAVHLTRIPRLRMESDVDSRPPPLTQRTVIEFTDAFRRVEEASGAARTPSRGEDTLVVVLDTGIDERVLKGIPLTPFPVAMAPLPARTDRPMHGTAVIAALHAVAPAARLQYVALPEDKYTLRWLGNVLGAITQARAGGGRLVVNMSWSYAVEKLGRSDDFKEMVASLFENAFKNGVVLVAPTGNATNDLPPDVMAFPASLRDVTAIGAATLQGTRARVSRYGRKEAGGGRWFMVRAPVDAGGELEPLVRIGARTFSRTSLVTAVASGLLARCGMLDPSPPSTDDVERTGQARRQADALLPLADRGLVPDYDPQQHGDGIMRYRPPPPPGRATT